MDKRIRVRLGLGFLPLYGLDRSPVSFNFNSYKLEDIMYFFNLVHFEFLQFKFLLCIIFWHNF